MTPGPEEETFDPMRDSRRRSLQRFVAGDDHVDHGVEVDGAMSDPCLAVCFTPPFNIASRRPVLAVPSGFADDGVPTGIQTVGRTYDDVSVFRAAAAYERARPWLDAPGRRPAL